MVGGNANTTNRTDMPYTVFTKQILRSDAPLITFTHLARMNLNMAAAHKIAQAGTDEVLLLWDAERLRVGIRPCYKKDERAYKIRYADVHTKRGANFSCKAFFDWIGLDYRKTRSYPATWNEADSLFEVSLQKSDLKADRKQQFDFGSTESAATENGALGPKPRKRGRPPKERTNLALRN